MRRRLNWHQLLPLALLVFIGVNLRTVLLGVPPVLPLIQRDLGLSHTGIGFLTALPVLVMGGAALPGGILAGRIGGRAAVAVGLVLLASGSALRALPAGAPALYLFTALFSLGIALAQPAIVALVRTWFPSRIGLASALYTDGIITGEALAAGLTVPVLLRWLGPDAWRASFLAWSLPVAAAVALWWLLAPRTGDRNRAGTADAADTEQASQAAQTTGRHLGRLGLHFGLLSGSGSLIYFNMNSWAASYDATLGHAAMSPLTLAILNGAQLPVCLGMTGVAQRLAGRRLPFMVSGLLCLASVIGWVWTPITWQPLWAAMLGGSSVAVLLLGTALPPLYASRTTVARLAGVTLSVSYAVSFCGQLAGGRLWDVTGRPDFAFFPVAVASIALIALGGFLPRRERIQRPLDATIGSAPLEPILEERS